MGDFSASASDFPDVTMSSAASGELGENLALRRSNITSSFSLSHTYFTFEPSNLASEGDLARIILFAHALSRNQVALVCCFYGIKFSVIMYDFTFVKVRQTVVLGKNTTKDQP